uniref:Unclassified n=1 Tax=Haemonchus placei TaxID=6290 RepID=A0A0N4WLV7_HAEPC
LRLKHCKLSSAPVAASGYLRYQRCYVSRRTPEGSCHVVALDRRLEP